MYKKSLIAVALLVIVAAGGLFTFQYFKQTDSSQINPVQNTTPVRNTTSNETVKTYKNEQFGFEFQYPKDWVFQENAFKSPFSVLNLVGASPEEGGIPNAIYSSILVNVVTPHFAENAISNIERLKGIKSETTIDGTQATRYEYDFEDTPRIDIFLPLGDHQIILGAQKRYEDVFNQILSTFKFLSK